MPDYAPPTRIRLISHPATAVLREGRVPADEALDAQALRELEGVRWRSNGTNKILTSPEIRTMDTATALGLDATAIPELRECDFGSWRGRSLEDVYIEDPKGCILWLSDLAAVPHGGGSFQELLTRVSGWLDSLSEAGPCIVVTHASIIRAALIHALSAPEEAFWRIEVPPLSMTDLRLSGDKWHVRSFGTPLVQELAE